MDPAVIENELKQHDVRIKSLHKRLGEVQVLQSDQMADIKVLGHEVEEARKDIGEVKAELGSAIRDAQKGFDQRLEKMQQDHLLATEKAQARFDQKFENLTTAVRWGTGTLLIAIGLLVTIIFGVH